MIISYLSGVITTSRENPRIALSTLLTRTPSPSSLPFFDSSEARERAACAGGSDPRLRQSTLPQRRPPRPGATRGVEDPDARYLHVHEDGAIDEEQVRSWVRQAAAQPGWAGF